MRTGRTPLPSGAMAGWLFSCCGLVFVMVLLGGLTRLTESGLSIVDWRPVTGWLPPLDLEEWNRLFGAYRETPEFNQLNFWMGLEDFKRIFWLEYLHRLLGRILGLVYAIPLVLFTLFYRLPPNLILRLVLLLVLGAAQGILGWYMVKSGLVDEPSVSHYRLAAHLGLAIVIYGLLLQTALRVRNGWNAVRTVPDRILPVAAALVFLTMIWGAFLAGLDGGAVFNTFPLMDGSLLPPDSAVLTPLWRNALENAGMVQFCHRALGTITASALVLVWYVRRREPNPALVATGILAIVQFALGAATVLTGASIAVAWLHQAGAMLLLTCVIWAWWHSMDSAEEAREA